VRRWRLPPPDTIWPRSVPITRERRDPEHPLRLTDLDLEAHLADPALKQQFVTPMFDLIAPRYDRFTRLFSLGMDRRWKSEITAWMTSSIAPGARVLDLACGTGDLAFAAAARATGGEVIGVDASPAMIDLARRRAATEASGRAVRFVVGDISGLDVESASVDAVTAGYALRNVPDYDRAIAEIARVLKPGGVLATLDFYRPESSLWRRLFLGYLAVAGNWIGWLWHREPVAYGYIARSIDHFVSWQAFSTSLAEHGLSVERVATKLLGGVALHFARRHA
jgi:demethylmenaquinone methyltransferase / 2-methoxy-6-polyprenyl-1,4-benzoquinol methylase